MAAWRKTEYPGDAAQMYALLQSQLEGLLDGEPNVIANLANASALLFQALPDINWAGFYLWTGYELLLGPFQGMPACVHIAPGRGVCGTAARQCRTVRVANVHEFPGHIACDSASNSEIVLPLMHGQTLWGVLDIDSPVTDRFTQEDEQGLESLAGILSGMICTTE